MTPTRLEQLEFFRDEILGDLGWSDDEPMPEEELTYAKKEIRFMQTAVKESYARKQKIGQQAAAIRQLRGLLIDCANELQHIKNRNIKLDDITDNRIRRARQAAETYKEYA